MRTPRCAELLSLAPLLTPLPASRRLGPHFPQRCVPHYTLFCARVLTDVLLSPLLSIAVGWISTIRALGDVFDIHGFYTWHLIMTILLCSVWVILFALTIWAFIKGKIFLAKPEEVIKDTVGPKAAEERSRRASMQSDAPSYNKEAHHHV